VTFALVEPESITASRNDSESSNWPQGTLRRPAAVLSFMNDQTDKGGWSWFGIVHIAAGTRSSRGCPDADPIGDQVGCANPSSDLERWINNAKMTNYFSLIELH